VCVYIELSKWLLLYAPRFMVMLVYTLPYSFRGMILLGDLYVSVLRNVCSAVFIHVFL
jgi:hypothetical protein